MNAIKALVFLATATICAAADYSGTCDIMFRADATMHGFNGNVAAEPFTAVEDNGALTLKVDVSPLKITTKEEERDHEVQKTLKAPDFALLHGEAKGVAIDSLKAEDAEMPFDLTIAGTTLPVKGVITGFEETATGYAFKVSFDVSMKSFGLKPKSMLGIIRVNDKVRVTCSFALSKS